MKFNKVVLILLILLSFTTLKAAKEGYSIKVKIINTKDSMLLLANYYGDKQYLIDTAFINKKGFFVFEKKKPLEGGIYLIVTQDKNYFEFIIDKEQVISFETSAGQMVEKMKIEGSIENTNFYDYMKYLAVKQKEMRPFQDSLKFVKSHADTIRLQNEILLINREIFNYKTDFLKKYPDYLISKVFIASKEVDVPDAPLLPDGKKDTKFQYYYYKNHFWDNVDLSDERLIRTPVFHGRLKNYFDNVVVQIPDSINVSADKLIEKVRGNKEFFKYIVWYVTNTYERSTYMGFDAVFVHMVETYYMTKQTDWVTATILENLTKRAMRLKPILLGKRAPSLVNPDSLDRWIFMDTIRAKFTVLIFWDSDCGHCKTEIPKLKKLYDEKKNIYNFEVYAVCTDADLSRWKKYVRENNLNWLNVTGTKANVDYHEVYDIVSTPVIYLLDHEKKIVAKRLDVENLTKYLEILSKGK